MNGRSASPSMERIRSSGQAAAIYRQAGVTLLELVISLGLGLMLVVGIGTVYVGSNQTYRVQEENARLQESGRYALEAIGRSIRQAGYVELSVSPVDTKTAFAGTVITGTNGAGSAPDTITVQYDWTNGASACDGTTAGVAGNFIQNSFNLDTVNFRLRCDGQVAAAPGAPGNGQPLVEGVEDLQMLYGIDTNGDQSADQYTATPANWNQVVTTRVCVLVRSTSAGV